ncbi:T-cell surface glycoprotein CD3 delta chain [Brachyhypopomus gauderio]|uniref:T-cell surface glycoprotein CD3 delta chain n=1 Tax=Brachyhypopomus gauderio TaxID=698409 RepID=UPI004042B858
MKWLTRLLLTGLVLKQTLAAESPIAVHKTSSGVKLECKGGTWNVKEKTDTFLNLEYRDENSGEKTCMEKNKIFVKFRTCDNCIELDVISIVGIIVGNILATFLIGLAVYSLSAQPRNKSMSGNKASDKKALLPNGENDTYQQLASGQISEYSALGGRRK